MDRKVKFDEQLDAAVVSIDSGPIPLPDHVLDSVAGGLLYKPPFSQFLQYSAFDQIIA